MRPLSPSLITSVHLITALMIASGVVKTIHAMLISVTKDIWHACLTVAVVVLYATKAKTMNTISTVTTTATDTVNISYPF